MMLLTPFFWLMAKLTITPRRGSNCHLISITMWAENDLELMGQCVWLG